MSGQPRPEPVPAKRPTSRPLETVKRPPSFAFLKGAGLGALVVVPLLAVAVWVTSRLGIGHPTVTMVEIIRMATIFAGVAAVLTAGGIGRLAAQVSTLPGGRRTAIWRAARAQAVASGGLAIIAAIPHGQLPEHPVKWLWIAAAGVVSGAIAGSVIGFACGTAVQPRAPTVKDILRAIPELAKTGASLTAIPAQKPAEPKPEPEAKPKPEPEPPPAAVYAKPKKRKRRKAPVTDPPKTESLATSSRAALVSTAPGATRLATPAAVDTSVATEPSSPTTDDGGATPLPKPVPLGDDITGVEDEPEITVKPPLPLPAEPSVPTPAPAPDPEPSPPVAKAPERVENTDVPTDIRTGDVLTDIRTADVITDVHDPAEPTNVQEPAEPTEPRGKP